MSSPHSNNDRNMVRSRFVDLVFRHLDGVSSADEVAELNRALVDHEPLRDLFVQLCLQDALCQQKLAPSCSRGAVHDDSSMFDANIILEAFEQEQRAKAARARRHAAEDQVDAADRSEARDWSALSGALDRNAVAPVRHIVIPKALVFAGIAALIALMVYPLLRSAPDEVAPSPAPIASATPLPPIVAELTGTLDARWDTADDIAVGAPLRQGVLRLLEGFAQVTMNDGTVLTLEAPVALELQSGSQVFLDAGRLVGRGKPRFVVRTAQSRVTDLGTEFGVEALQLGETHVHVFDGAVELAAVRGDQVLADQRVVEGQSGAVDRDLRLTIDETPPSHHAFVCNFDDARRRIDGQFMFDDFSRDTSYQYNLIDSYNQGGAFRITDGALVIHPGHRNTASVVLTERTGVLRVGTRWGVDIPARRQSGGVFVFASTRAVQPGPILLAHPSRTGAAGIRIRRGHRRNPTGAPITNHLLLELDDEIVASVPDPGGVLTIWIERPTPAELRVVYELPGGGEPVVIGEVQGVDRIEIEPELYVGVEAFREEEAFEFRFDNLRWERLPARAPVTQ